MPDQHTFGKEALSTRKENEMQLIGQAIKHITFGKGIVTDWDNSTITVCFSVGEKRFLYPDAFLEYLTLKNEAMQSKVKNLLAERESIREAQRQKQQQLDERKSRIRRLKITNYSQAVFRIETWQKETLFSSWSVSTGYYLSGSSKGEVRIPDRLKPNSMCLLTECAAGQPESERRIIGMFMVEEDFWGICCDSGIIEAHPTYRLQLPPEHSPLFWPYVTESPEKPNWGKTSFKYMATKTGEKILSDVRTLPLCAECTERAEQFYEYYCKINRLPTKQEEEQLLADNC